MTASATVRSYGGAWPGAPGPGRPCLPRAGYFPNGTRGGQARGFERAGGRGARAARLIRHQAEPHAASVLPARSAGSRRGRTSYHPVEVEAVASGTGGKMRRITATLAVATAIVTTGVMGAVPALASHVGKAGSTATTYYLSLGDSLAQGVQPNSMGVSVETKAGYPNQLATALRQTNPSLRLVKLGCPGETTATMVNGGILHVRGGLAAGAGRQVPQAARGPDAARHDRHRGQRPQPLRGPADPGQDRQVPGQGHPEGGDQPGQDHGPTARRPTRARSSACPTTSPNSRAGSRARRPHDSSRPPASCWARPSTMI